jgi:hypothetical protein
LFVFNRQLFLGVDWLAKMRSVKKMAVKKFDVFPSELYKFNSPYAACIVLE